MMREEIERSWENFLNPDKMRHNLIIASLYITAFEVLRATIINRLKGFFMTGGPDGLKISSEYEKEVLARNRSPLYASLDWFKSINAISDADIEIYECVKTFRNRLAHEIPQLLMDGFQEEFRERFGEIVHFVDKIERWWILNIELSINPEFDGKDVDEKNMTGGSVTALQIMMDVALGTNEEAGRYLKEWHRIRATQPFPPEAD